MSERVTPLIGLSMTANFLRTSGPPAQEVARAAEAAGLDYLQVGDHVSFLDGTGFDGLVLASAALAYQQRLPVHVGLYLLALRHPLLVARQVADLARLAPGRLVLGVGVGGEDRLEFENCGVDPSTRGKRTDESITLLRQLLTGASVTSEGDFFTLQAASISPAPAQPVPVIVGGRSPAALRRAGLVGDGWLGLWVSPERYKSAIARIASIAVDSGRSVDRWQHGLNMWCGVHDERSDGRSVLAAAMEKRYKMPFERFARWCPTGSAADVAKLIGDYAEAGCTSVTLVLHNPDPFDAIAAAAAVRSCVHADQGHVT